MAEDVVIRYRAEVDQATKDLKVFVEQNKALDKQSQQTAKGIDKETASVKKLETEVADTGKKLTATGQTTKKFGAEANKTFDSLTTQIRSFGSAAAISIGAAFSVGAIIEFGKASVNAFLDAEKNAERLKFAITAIGGESEAAFQRLINQSEKLQKITIFSDDSIQQAQAALSAFGLTANQIEELIPKLANFATVTGTDIPEAASKIGAALEGNGREFKKYGIFVDAAASRTDNLNAILSGLVKFEGSAEAATKTLSGQLEVAKNEADNLQESLGARLAPIFVSFRLSVLKAVEGLLGFNKALDDLKQQNFDAVAKNFDDAANKIKASGGDLVAEFTKRKDSITASNQAIIDSNIKLSEQLKERLTIISQSKLDLNPDNDPVIKSLTKQIELNENNLALQKEKLSVIEGIISKENEVTQATERTLKASQLEALSIQELTKLREKEQQIKDRFSNDNIDLINKELELKKKAFEAASKLEQEELKKNLEILAALRLKNIEDLKQQRIAAFEKENSELTAKGKLRDDIIKEREIQLVKDLNEIDKQRNVDPLFRVPANTTTVPDTLTIPDSKKSTRTEDPEAVDVSNQQILESSANLFSELTSLYATFTDFRISEIERAKDAELSAIDQALAANEKALDKGRITEVEAQQNKEKLLAQRLAAEKKAAEEERKIKRKQAILDKAAALFQIAIATAANVAKYPPPNPLGYIAIATGAAEAALVAAQPIPYKKGTKGAKGGLSLVGEQGPELTMLPAGTKVLPTKQTKTHSEAIDAMFDNRFESFVLDRYVNPALMRAKKEKQIETQKSFADNITNSMVLNQQGLTEHELEKVRKRGYNINNAQEIAEALAKVIRTDPYRR